MNIEKKKQSVESIGMKMIGTEKELEDQYWEIVQGIIVNAVNLMLIKKKDPVAGLKRFTAQLEQSQENLKQIFEDTQDNPQD